MKAIWAFFLWAIVGSLVCFGQLSQGKAPAQGSIPSARLQPVRMTVRSADPWYIVGMMEGRSIVSPELSTILGFPGFQQAAQAVNRLFDSGHLIVNPTDNSIWWIPDQS